MPWYKLESIEQLEMVIEASEERPQIIYKHSTRCHTCADILKDLNKSLPELEKKAGMLFLDLLSRREISNEISSRFDIVHQSPQVLVIHKGKAVFTAEHWDIKPEILLSKLKAETN